MSRRNTFEWPIRAMPRLHRCGIFDMGPENSGRLYRSDTHALHLHNYIATIRIGPDSFELAPGDLTFSPAGIPSVYSLAQPGRHWCIHFHPASESDEQIPLPLHARLGPRSAFVEDRLKAIVRTHNRPGADDTECAVFRARAAAAFQWLMLWLAEPVLSLSVTGGRTGTVERALEQVVELIEGHLGKPITVPWVARSVGMSQNYLARQFRGRFGITIQQHLFRRRMEQAKALLETSILPVKAIGAQVGYPDPQHFNKAFRRAEGICPSAFRARV